MTTVMTTTEAAEYLQIDPATVRRHAAKGTMPARKIGNTWRFSRSLLDEWLAGHYSNAANDSSNNSTTTEGKDVWHSSKETTSITSTFRSTDEEYEKALGLR